MPAKRKDEESSSEEESSEEEFSAGSSEEEESEEESSEEESSEEEEERPAAKKPVVTTAPAPAPAPAAKPSTGANVVANKPHDEEFAVEDEGRNTPPDAKRAPPAAAGGKKPVLSGSQKLENNPNDESFAVEDDEGHKTPPGTKKAAPAPTAAAKKPMISGAATGKLANDPNDEFEDVEDDLTEEESEEEEEEEITPVKKTTGPTGSQVMKNEQHDEAFDVGSSPGSSAQASPARGIAPLPAKAAPMPVTSSAATGVKPLAKPSSLSPQRDDEDEETEDEDESSEDEDATPKMKGNVELPTAAAAASNLEYNPQDYAFLNAKVSREVRDLFSHITAYQPTSMELPSKLIPFVPSYIPCVGDIDVFCKVPRPDGLPDNLGLVVVDEPSCQQSNPAVVKIGLQYSVGKGKQERETFVDSVEDSAQRPAVVDRWIADIKKLPKQLPTVTYTKPMPQIEQLMQIWPAEFEEMLNSDVQLPSPQIDLDIHQYVRVLCSILDIPTYSNLVESLHVMFTLYLEFRANPHFQHS